MSADNQVIVEKGEDGIFRGYDRQIDGDYSDIEEKPIFETSSVEGVVAAAENYMSENIVEYGYRFCFPRVSLLDQKEDNDKMNKNKMNKDEMMKGITIFLEGLGLNLTDQHFVKTPERIVRAYFEIFRGMGCTENKVKDIINTAFVSKSDQMIIVKDIHVFSMCPHHFLPVEYYISVAYIPSGKVLGLSKIPRLVELLAKRPIIQEDLTEEIAETLMIIKPLGVAVKIEGQHLCMRMRGIEKPESAVITSSVIGVFREDLSARNEFFSQIRNSNF
ncbi:MAG: GTP cyclohydrolase I FolE [Candidatus Heimdallarchaeaceae archaeon]